MAAYRILSLDGGGIRGVLTATLLERLETAHPGFLKQIDLFAGTSTGGILALGLAAGMSPTQARKLYERCGRHVFADTILDDARDLGRLVGADYSTGPLIEILAGQFGAMTLGDLPKRVLVPTFDLDNAPETAGVRRMWKAKYFHNYPGPGTDAGEKVVDVAVRTSAAPTYFPIYQGYIDGGVVANNPAMSALAQALHPTTGGQELSNLVLLSVGTGYNPRHLESMNGDWGLTQWAPHLINLMLEGGAGVVEYQCHQILDQRFLRLNPLLPAPIGLDRVDQIPLLMQMALNFDLTQPMEWLGKYFD